MIKNRTTATLTAAVIVMAGCLIYCMIQNGLLRVQAAWASEQIEVCHSMMQKSQTATAKDAISYLGYTVGYYPSGTKQVRGSTLDKAVERVRADAVARILTRLRSLTGKDLGDDPVVWMSAREEDLMKTQ